MVVTSAWTMVSSIERVESMSAQTEEMSKAIREKDEKISEMTYSMDLIARKNSELLDEISELKMEVERLKTEPVSRGASKGFRVEATAYTDGGHTAMGVDLTGQTLESAMVIAVDPDIIPLGSQVRVHFEDSEWQKYNGIYTAADTGGAIQGHIIDLFMGHGNDDEAMDFGRRMARVEVL